ncbi:MULTISPECIES: HPP family protein [unclassified Haladaptatus]|uniref:HPP family protein n=1 Tax=unclassified Haladaptatus TaxID=2622732 RepID=UPI0023E86D70|nr:MULTISPECIES: HPP family protein [unclassified Haladaptatus]
MRRRRLRTSLYAGALFTVLGALAWVTGQPFIFPSLGPSAFILAVEQKGPATDLRRVVGSHFIGALAGLVAYLLFANGVVVTATLAPSSPDGLRLAASGILSISLTSFGMFETDTVHAPACATTLIVSLGLLSTPYEAATIVVSVTILVAAHQVTCRSIERFRAGDPSRT